MSTLSQISHRIRANRSTRRNFHATRSRAIHRAFMNACSGERPVAADSPSASTALARGRPGGLLEPARSIEQPARLPVVVAHAADDLVDARFALLIVIAVPLGRIVLFALRHAAVASFRTTAAAAHGSSRDSTRDRSRRIASRHWRSSTSAPWQWCVTGTPDSLRGPTAQALSATAALSCGTTASAASRVMSVW